MDDALAPPRPVTHHLDTLLVRLASVDDAPAIVAACGGKLTRRMSLPGWVIVALDPSGASDIVAAYIAHPNVLDVEFNFELGFCETTPYAAGSTDPLIKHQYGLWRMRVPLAWAHVTPDPSVKVGVCDSGLYRPQFPDFADMDVTRWTTVQAGDGDPDNAGDDYVLDPAINGTHQDSTGTGTDDSYYAPHGTQVAATLLGPINKGFGAAGVAPHASLISMRIGTTGITAADGAEGIVSCAKLGAHFINCSWGGAGNSALYADALAYLNALPEPPLAIFAAGNEYSAAAFYPAAVGVAAGHLSVGATTYEETDRPAYYTSYGDSPNIVAPGHYNYVPYYWNSLRQVNLNGQHLVITGTPDPLYFPHGDRRIVDQTLYIDHILFDGTSCASPMVAGVCVLVKWACPALTPMQVRDIVLSTVDKAQNPYFYEKFTRPGIGIVNALKAVLKARALAAPLGVFPYVQFFGDGVEYEVDTDTGAASVLLSGVVHVEVNAYSSEPLVAVRLWAGADLIYEGPPRTTWDALLPVDASRLAGRTVRVDGLTAASSETTEYSGIVALDPGPQGVA